MRNEEERIREILVLAITRMGDLIQQTPLLSALRAAYPAARITVLVEEKFREVCGGIPYIDRVVSWNKAALVREASDQSRSLVERLRLIEQAVFEIGPGHFDLIVNMIHSQFGALIVRLVPHREVWGMTMDDEGYRAIRSPWLRYFFTAVSHRRFNTFNLVDMYRLNVPGPEGPGRLVFNVSREARQWAGEFLREFGVRSSESGHLLKDPSPPARGRGLGEGAGRPLVAIQPGASKEERRWPPERFGELARALAGAGCRVLLLGVEGERPSAEIVKRTAGVETIDAVGKTSIDRLGALLENVSLLVTNDTGTMHMAAAVGTRVLMLSMCHSNPFETGPYGDGHWVVSPRIACYPCEFSTECPDRACTRMIPVEAVAEAAHKMLSGDGPVAGGPIWESVDLWRSGFDGNGLLDFRPLLRRVVTGEGLSRLIQREVWKLFLGSGDEREVGEVVWRRIAERFLRAEDLPARLDAMAASFEAMAEKARRGERIAREIMRMAGAEPSSPARLDAIEALGKGLQGLDEEIEVLAETERALASFVRYFLFCKEAISGAGVAELAGQTAEAYADLERLAELSRTLVSVLAALTSGAPAHQSVFTA